MPEISKALRHEIIEANEDDVTGDVAHATRAGKRSAGKRRRRLPEAPPERSTPRRPSAPPPVPETRRAGIQTYFSRKQ